MIMISSNRFYLSLFLFSASIFSSQTSNTITTSQTLSDIANDTVISSAGAFALGFFSPGNSENRYIGIWYNKIKERTVVWIANKDEPLGDNLGRLVLVGSGRLVLLNSTNATTWSTNSSTRVAKNPVAQLLDSGNLVVRDADDENPENYVWQSFDYPSDTFLPGMKLGRNFRTGWEVYITSVKNNDDPATGGFTYHCDPSGYPQTEIKEGGSVRFKTGPWNGVRFSGSQNLVRNTIFSFGVVIDKDEVYYHYQLLNESVYMRFVLSESGVGQRWLWSYQTENWILYLTIPTDNCDIYRVCGAYGICNTKTSPDCSCLDKFEPNDPRGWAGGDFSKGCTRRTSFYCQNGDRFLKYSGVKLPDTEHSWYNASMSLEECKLECSRNCSCTAYASLDISRRDSGCLLWFGDLVDMRNINPGQDIYIRMAKSELDNNRTGSGRSKKREILIVTLSAVMGILLLGASLLLYYKKRKKPKLKKQESDRLSQNYVDIYISEDSHDDIELPMFELSTIIKATDDFSLSNKLGEGGFGPVYKGMLEGQEIAVKRLSRSSLQGAYEFKNEVICIAKLQHRNLVKLLGCCIQGEERILVYEYMTNKSLDLILFDQKKRMMLDWPRRFNIINGIARGLMYLHQDSRLRVIHRDLKASNILLDSDMIPKISDFGLAKTLGGNETGANTSRVVGTYGYMSPEYAVEGTFSVKSDVYSFGVLVLEIISGKRNRGFSQGGHSHNLLGHVSAQVVRSIHVGLLCVQEQVNVRPDMSSVVLMLNNDGVLPEAKHPGFFTGRDVILGETSNTSDTAGSGNAMTISLLINFFLRVPVFLSKFKNSRSLMAEVKSVSCDSLFTPHFSLLRFF